MPRKDKHLTKKGIITIIVLCLCALTIYLIWGKGSLYLLNSHPKSTSSLEHNAAREEQTNATQNIEKPKEQDTRLCLLNNGKCQVTFMKDETNQEQIRISIEAIPSNIIALESVVFRAQGAELSNLTGKIVGLNMDMGETIVHFNKIDDLLYEGRAIMAPCTQEIMQYRMHLSTQDASTQSAVDFDAKRKE